MNGLADFLKGLGTARVAAMGAVALGLVGFFVYIIMRFSTPQMSLLFADLTLEDSAQVVRELERRQVRYQLKNDGAQILVSQDQVARVRMQLAEGGLPRGGGSGYELFDKGDALSSTSFVQNINQLRALEGELSRTIRGIDRVQTARVHLVMPERPLFSRDRVEPTASIVLRVRGGLEPQQIRAIRHLVASAVRGLSPQRVSIVDEGGRLLADGAGDQNGGGAVADERRTAHEKRVRDQVESIIASVVGPGRTRVQVAADMDFNRITQTSDDFDPERRVVRSTQTKEEQSSSNEAQRDNQVSVGNELPNANNAGGGGGGNQSREASRKSEEVVNYEIARTQRTEVIEGGRIRRISVAVLVDGIYSRDAQGNVAYQPRPQEELDRIGALVRSSIGFDQRRGDQVEIVNLRFAEAPQLPALEAPKPWWMIYEPTKEDIKYAIELGVLLLVSLLVMLLVVRPLIRRIVTPEEEKKADKPAGGAAEGAAAAGAGFTAINGGAAGQIESPSIAPHLADSATMKMIEQAKIQGEVHAASLAKIGELVEKNPHETVSIVRNWLNEV
ncbi:MAG: flagellar basal-body MS-ring/collar protein FliF [Alphaproteobacteria bacterium]